MQRRTFLVTPAVLTAAVALPALAEEPRKVRLCFSMGAWELTEGEYTWDAYVACLSPAARAVVHLKDKDFKATGAIHLPYPVEGLRDVVQSMLPLMVKTESVWVTLLVDEESWERLIERELYYPDPDFHVCVGVTREEAELLRDETDRVSSSST